MAIGFSNVLDSSLDLSLITDDRNFYGIFSSIISSKKTKTDPNTKENLQKQEKIIKTESKMPKDKKKPKE
jgi:hypothetical protein